MAILNPKDLFAVYTEETGLPYLVNVSSDVNDTELQASYDLTTGTIFDVQSVDEPDGGSSATFEVEVVDGEVTEVKIVNGGVDYQVDDEVELIGDNGYEKIRVTSVSSDGAIEAFEYTSSSSGIIFKMTNGAVYDLTTTSTESGSGLILKGNVSGGRIESFDVYNDNFNLVSPYVVGEEVNVDPTASGADASKVLVVEISDVQNSGASGGIVKYDADSLKEDVVEWGKENAPGFSVVNAGTTRNGHPGGYLELTGSDYDSELTYYQALGREWEYEIRLRKDDIDPTNSHNYGKELSTDGSESGVELEYQEDLNIKSTTRLDKIEETIYAPFDPAADGSNWNEPRLKSGVLAFDNRPTTDADTSRVSTLNDYVILEESHNAVQDRVEIIEDRIDSLDSLVLIQSYIPAIDTAQNATESNKVYANSAEALSNTVHDGITYEYVSYSSITQLRIANKVTNIDGDVVFDHDYTSLNKNDNIILETEFSRAHFSISGDPVGDGDFTNIPVEYNTIQGGLNSTIEFVVSQDGNDSTMDVTTINDRTSERYVETDGDTMTGSLSIDKLGDALVFSGSDEQNIQTLNDLNITAGDVATPLMKFDTTTSGEEFVSFYNKNVTGVSTYAANDAKASPTDIVNRAYVDARAGVDLRFRKTLDATSEGPDGDAVAGDLYIHSGSDGAADSAWSPVTNITDGAKLALGVDGSTWYLVGNVFSMGISYESFEVDVVPEDNSHSGGNLTYDNAGKFTYTPAFSTTTLDTHYIKRGGDTIEGSNFFFGTIDAASSSKGCKVEIVGKYQNGSDNNILLIKDRSGEERLKISGNEWKVDTREVVFNTHDGKNFLIKRSDDSTGHIFIIKNFEDKMLFSVHSNGSVVAGTESEPFIANKDHHVVTKSFFDDNVTTSTITFKQPGIADQTFEVNQDGNKTIEFIDTKPNNGKIVINQGGIQKGQFTVNTTGTTTIELDGDASAVDATKSVKGIDYQGKTCTNAGVPTASQYQRGTMVVDTTNKALYVVF